MTKIKSLKSLKISALVLSFLMLFSVVLPSITYAKTNDNISNKTENTTDYMRGKEYGFYFSKVGHFDENKNYVITNPALLKERADSGDEGAKKLYNAYLQKNYSSALIRGSWSSYGKCIVKGYVGPLVDLLNGKYFEAIGSAMASQAWGQAGKILGMALAEVSKKAGVTVNVAFSAAELAYYAYTCRGYL